MATAIFLGLLMVAMAISGSEADATEFTSTIKWFVILFVCYDGIYLLSRGD